MVLLFAQGNGRWVDIGNSGKSRVLYDSTSLHPTHARPFTIWIKYQHPADDFADDVDHELTQFIISCPQHETGLLQSIVYFRNGAVNSRKGSGQLESVVPDSITEGLVNIFCK